jgi:phage tail sheath gpL-like
MTIPTAVSPSVMTPGLYLTVDLLAGTAGIGSEALRVALLASKSSGGDLTNDTEVRAGGGVDAASDAYGPGTLGHLMAKIIYGKYPAAQIDFVSPTPGAGTATLSLTAAGSVGSNQVVDFDIMGREFEVAWLYGVSAAAFATSAIAAINALTDDLAVTAVTGGAGVMAINSKVTGNIGNDVLVKAKLRYAQTGTESFTGALVHTNLAGGTTDPDFANSLSAISGKEYHFILPALSNTDIEQVASDNGLQDCLAHVAAYNTGLMSKLQQIVIGYTGDITHAVATAADANGGDDDVNGEILLCVNGRSLPGEFGAREVAGRLAMESIDPAGNRIGELLDLVTGSWDIIADRPTLAESETCLDGGVSLVTYTAGDSEQLARAVTCRGSDKRCTDVQNVSATYIVARDVRDNLPAAFPNAKITRDTIEGDDPPPAGVLEERDVKAWCINRLGAWVRKGTLQKESIDSAIADGSLIVQVNDSDDTQLDIVLPWKIVQPLAKFGVVAQRIPG